MADGESASSSSVQQPTTSTINLIPIALEVHVEQQQSQQLSGGASSTTTTTSSADNNKMHDDEPEAKKIKLNRSGSGINKIDDQYEKLECRLGRILCCAICLDLPKTTMYQCQMGHLMCASCFCNLLADGRLREQIATCPNCRVEIFKNKAIRNLAVEKAASELPSKCQFCNKEFPYKGLERHENIECHERSTSCKFSRIGCQWRGPAHEAMEHESVCSHPHKSGFEVMSAVDTHYAQLEKDKKVFSTLIDLLSYEKVLFHDLKSVCTDEYGHKLFYETSRFSAFKQQWVVKTIINNSQRDPHQSNIRTITYQLILKTETSTSLSIHFFALKGPFSDMKIETQIHKHDFTDQSTESDYYILRLPDSSECNQLLSHKKAINFRLLMFLLNK